jgi:K+-transporting ATPase ATPase C chain
MLQRPLLLLVLCMIIPTLAVGQKIIAEQGNNTNLLIQRSSSPQYFQGRPSTIGPTITSSLINTRIFKQATLYCLPGSPLCKNTYAALFRLENGIAPNVQLPADIVTASGSSITPDISFSAASLQIDRIVAARRASGGANATITREKVQALLLQHLQQRGMDEPYVNVLSLDRALDASFGAPPAHHSVR